MRTFSSQDSFLLTLNEMISPATILIEKTFYQSNLPFEQVQAFVLITNICLKNI